MRYKLDENILIERKGDNIVIEKKDVANKMFFTINDITGAMCIHELLVIFVRGLNGPDDFREENIENLKKYPTCIYGDKKIIEEIYDELMFLTQDIDVI